MTQYHQKAQEISSIGQELSVFGSMNTTITLLRSLLKPGEVLIGLSDNGVFQVAPLLESQEDLTFFYQRYRSGQSIRMGYYALPADSFRTN